MICTTCGIHKPIADFGTRRRSRCNECRAAQQREWARANAEKVRAGIRSFYLEHRTERLAYAAEYRAAHRDEMRAKSRAYNQANRDRIRAHKQQVREEKRDIIRANNNLRKARQRNAAVSDFTGAQWTAMKAAYDHRCVYCGVRPERLTMDHVIPLSKGGNHTASNIVPACMPCNLLKRAGEAPPRVLTLPPSAE